MVLLLLSCSESNTTIYGSWKLLPAEGTDIVVWRYRQQELDISNEQGEIKLLHNFIYRREVAYTDSMIFVPGAQEVVSLQTTPNWSGNWYMGVLTKVGSEKKVSGEWKQQDKVLQVEREEIVETSQGEIQLNTSREYRIDGDRLIVEERRSTRPTPVTLVFEKQS
jgi:hypothetical protein